MLRGEAVIRKQNRGLRRRGKGAGLRLVTECRADHIATAVDIEHGRFVTLAGGDDQRRDAARIDRPRNRPSGGRELGHHGLERGARPDEVRVAGEHAS